MADMRVLDTIAYGNARAGYCGMSSEVKECLQKRFIALDTETTGLAPEKDRIVEVAVLLFEEGQITDRFVSYVNPGITIAADVSAVNHITDEMFADAPKPEEVYPELLSFLGAAVKGETLICGHVTAFDLSFLCHELSMLETPVKTDFRFVDTRRLAVGNSALESHSLAAVAAYYHIPHEYAHHAEEDAAVSGQIMLKMLGNKSGDSYE